MKTWRETLVLFSIVLVSCSDPFPEYTEVTGNLYLRIHVLGEGETYPDSTDMIVWRVVLSTVNDSVFYRTPANLELAKRAVEFRNLPVVLQPGMLRLMQGDSATFVASAALLGGSGEVAIWQIPDGVGDWVKINLVVDEILTATELSEKKSERSKRINTLIAEENEDLKGFLAKEAEEPYKAYYKGIYFFEKEVGTGAAPAKGDVLVVNYRARFTNGTVFDDTFASNTPLEFRYADPDQVIPGLDVGVSKMKEGGKARLVIPFDMGFGVKGSSSGIVPPCKTLVYDVELTKIERVKRQG